MFGLIASFATTCCSGRQLVPGFEQAELKCLVDLLDELEIGGYAGRRVELELDH